MKGKIGVEKKLDGKKVVREEKLIIFCSLPQCYILHAVSFIQ